LGANALPILVLRGWKKLSGLQSGQGQPHILQGKNISLPNWRNPEKLSVANQHCNPARIVQSALGKQSLRPL
jgi:hypothetical protein